MMAHSRREPEPIRRQSPPSPAPTPQGPSCDREQVLEAALARAARSGWDALTLHAVAADLGWPLARLAAAVPGKDALAEAWFDRADAAMWAAADQPGWAHRPPAERLHGALMAWLDTLAPQREITRAMLRYKLQPDHLHLQALGVARVSRTVQWWREAALLHEAGWRREAGEAVLTALYLTTLAGWLADRSRGATVTRERLRHALRWCERAAQRLGYGRGGG
jgi:ubiquinone biosynthesis protein COQ9